MEPGEKKTLRKINFNKSSFEVGELKIISTKYLELKSKSIVATNYLKILIIILSSEKCPWREIHTISCFLY